MNKGTKTKNLTTFRYELKLTKINRVLRHKDGFKLGYRSAGLLCGSSCIMKYHTWFCEPMPGMPDNHKNKLNHAISYMVL
jgi:hypothetical protein